MQEITYYNIGMKTKYEFLNFPSEFPLKISLRKVIDKETTWHSNIHIFYILDGEASIKLNNNLYNLKTDDVILINPWTIYEFDAPDELVYIDIQMNIQKFGTTDIEYDNLYFDCNSASAESNKFNYNVLKSCIIALIKLNVKNKTNLKYINNSLAYQMLYVLMEQFQVENSDVRNVENKHFKVLRKIINYIDNNYEKDISLNEIADIFGYTPQYFSSFFSKHMNQTFQAYYDTLRINSHAYMLESNDFSLEEISIKSGFTDYRSYIRAFKNIYKITPSEYRKTKLAETPINDDLSFDTKHYLDIIFKHKIGGIDEISSTIDTTYDINIDFSKNGEEIKKTFLNVTSVGRASDLLRENVRNMLEQAQKEIGFKYIKFHGIFSDDMHLYRKFINGQVSYSFVFIDQIIDYLLSINLRPFLELSFMPRDLAKNKSKILFESKFIISEPSEIEEWNELVRQFFFHLIDKYTLDEVLKWPITIWCEPDSTTNAFGFSDDYTFFSFYESTFKTIKEINSKFKVGSPSLIPFASWAIDWDKRFLKYCEQNECYPNFLCVTYYSNDFDFFINGKKIEKISKNPDNLKEYINVIKDPRFYKGDRIYLSQWNLTSSQRNYLNDTIFSSCYLTKNILENMDRLECFTKFTLTDFIDETQIPNKAYHGGPGLFTYNGICKASYQALRFLSKLKNNCLTKGNSYYITKDKTSIQIIVYNYEHYSDLYADGEYFSLKEHSRYDPFLMNKVNKYLFHFENLPYQYAIVKVSRISKESGSSYDIYDKMSHLELNDKEQTEDVKNLSTPKFENFKVDIVDGKFDLSIKANSLEVKLIEIKLYKERKTK